MTTQIKTSESLNDVRYEIRGQLAQRANEMERQGSEIISLNIGNPGIPLVPVVLVKSTNW